MKKNKAKENRQRWSDEIINYLTGMGYGKETAKYEVSLWIDGGYAFLSETPKRDIKNAMTQIAFSHYM